MAFERVKSAAKDAAALATISAVPVAAVTGGHFGTTAAVTFMAATGATIGHIAGAIEDRAERKAAERAAADQSRRRSLNPHQFD